MARNRVINPEFWLDEEVATLSPSARLLYIGLWSICDDNHATLPNRPEWIKAQIFPYNSMNVASLLQEISKIGKIILFRTEAGEFWYIKNLLKHQKIDHPSKEKYPPFDESSVITRESSGSPQEALDLKLIEVNSSKDKYSVRGKARDFVNALFKGFKENGIEIQDAAGERQKYPSLFRRKNPDPNYWIAVAKFSQRYTFQSRQGRGGPNSEYVFPWRGPIKLSKIYYEVREKYEEERSGSSGKKKLEEMKAGVMKSF